MVPKNRTYKVEVDRKIENSPEALNVSKLANE